MPTLPRIDLGEKLEELLPPEDSEAEPLPPPPVEEPIPHVPVIQRPIPSRDRLVANRYEILEQIGTGGMGKIFRVKHFELGKLFALKIIHSELSENQQARDMFYAEARLASSLEHRNIVSITDFGEDIRRGAFIVMEFLKGESLADRLDRERRQPPVVALDLITQTADAVAFMHERGVIHGDLKPENVFLSVGEGRFQERRRNQVKVLDFGLSRLKRSHRAHVGRLQEDFAGTPAYLAPECCCGAPPDEASDQYALGVLFYEVLTGEVPFDGNVAQILNAHISTPPTPPSWRLKGETLHERFDDLILTCLAKDPAARFSSVRVFLDELVELMEREGMAIRRSPTPTSPPQRHTGELDCRTIVETNPLPMFAVDSEGVLSLVNQSFCLFVKKETDDLLGRPLSESRLATFCPGIVDDLQVVLQKNKVTSRELEFSIGPGRNSKVLIWLTPLAASGIIVGAHGVVHWIRK